MEATEAPVQIESKILSLDRAVRTGVFPRFVYNLSHVALTRTEQVYVLFLESGIGQILSRVAYCKRPTQKLEGPHARY